MSRKNVNYNEKQGISHVFTLTNVTTNESVAMIPSDSEGNFSYSGITKAPLTRNAMQTTQSSGEWSDLEYPWQAIQQEDWGGGRGNLRFSTDKSRFYDSRRAQTAFNSCIYNAPLEYYSRGLGREVSTNWPGSLYWEKVSGDKKFIAVRFTCDETTSAGEVYIHLRRRGTPEQMLTVELCEDVGGSIVLASRKWSTEAITDTLAEFKKFRFDTITLTGGKKYYVRVSSKGATSTDYWEVGCSKNSKLQTRISSDGETFRDAPFELYYRVAAPQNDYRSKFFNYEQLQFMLWWSGTNSTPSIRVNGDIGEADSATSSTITDSSKSWTANQWKDATLGLLYKTGAKENVLCWHKIVSNTSTTITIDGTFPVTPTNCIFIIKDTPYWHEITGHGLTSHVTDVHVVRGVVYFAQGDYTNARKMRWNNGDFEFAEITNVKATFLQSVRDVNGMMLYRGRNDGVDHKRTVERARLLDWSTAISAGSYSSENGLNTSDGIAYTTSVDFSCADYDAKRYKVKIESYSSQDNRGSVVITLQGSDDNTVFYDIESVTANSTGNWYITAHCPHRYRRFKIDPTGYWVDPEDNTNIVYTTVNTLTMTVDPVPYFEDPIYLIDNYGKITRLFEYGAEQEKSLWIFQEGMVSSVNKTENAIDTYNLDRINIDELATTADMYNGRAVGTADVYLMWGWLNGLQRYYNTQIEGKGPDHDEGMPDDMKGRVSQILSYPSNTFISIDAGTSGYSSVMMFNGNGWHNIYRAPNAGERIHDIAFQPIYGERPDRLWINVGGDVIWLAMPSKILYAPHDPNAEYTHESVVVSSWITGGMAEVTKLWQSLSIMADGLDGKTCLIEADYQLDDEEQWHPIPGNPYDTSPQQEKEFAREDESVNGKKLRYRLRLQTTDMHKTPKVNVILIKELGKVDIKFSYSFGFRNIKYKANLSGEYEEIEPYELDEILDEWANDLATLRLNSAYKIFDNKKVFIDGVQTSVIKEKEEGYLGQITVTEI